MNWIYLMNMLLHSEPVFVADVDATIPPFIVIGSLSWIEQSLFGILHEWNWKYFLVLANVIKIMLSEKVDSQMHVCTRTEGTFQAEDLSNKYLCF